MPSVGRRRAGRVGPSSGSDNELRTVASTGQRLRTWQRADYSVKGGFLRGKARGEQRLRVLRDRAPGEPERAYFVPVGRALVVAHVQDTAAAVSLTVIQRYYSNTPRSR